VSGMLLRHGNAFGIL
jgi:hypothetical protein